MKLNARILLLIFGLIVIDTSAKTVYDQFCLLNINWKTISPAEALLHDSVFTSDASLIRMHLLEVEKRLRKNSNPADAHYTTRLQLLDTLHAYALRGQFPINTHHPGERKPYFIDDAGTACAVGYLIIASGNPALAQRISNECNYAYLRDIHTDGLSDWQKQSGFTFDELALIQPTYDFERRPPPVSDGKIPAPTCGKLFYPNGVLRAEGQCKNDILDGTWKAYSADGTLRQSGHYTKGEKDGTWKMYYPSGKVKTEEQYKNNHKNGVSKVFSETGELTEEKHFKDNKADGDYFIYAKGEKQYLGHYTSGMRDGHWKHKCSINGKVCTWEDWFSNDTLNRTFFIDPQGDTLMSVMKSAGKTYDVRYYSDKKLQRWSKGCQIIIPGMYAPNQYGDFPNARFVPDYTIVEGVKHEIVSLGTGSVEEERKYLDTVSSNYERGVRKWFTYSGYGGLRDTIFVENSQKQYNSEVFNDWEVYRQFPSAKKMLTSNQSIIRISRTSRNERIVLEWNYGNNQQIITRANGEGKIVSKQINSATGTIEHFVADTSGMTRYVIRYGDKESNPDKRIGTEGQLDRNNARQGFWKMTYRDSIVTANYSDGQKNGEEFLQLIQNNNPNSGTLKEKRTWKNDQRDGEHTEYAANRKVIVRGQYLNGQRSGTWYIRDENNSVKKRIYNNGKLEKEKRCKKREAKKVFPEKG